MIKIKIKHSSQLYEAEKVDNKIKTKNLEVLRGRYPSMDPRSPMGEIPHNFIEDLIDQDFRVRYIDVTDDDYEGPQASGNTFVEELVEMVPPLKINRIVQVVAGESFGKIFKLDNDHILKIFVGGVNPDEDMAWYKKCKDLLHSGEARKTTLPVYEAEKIALPSFPGYDVYFAEMARFKPLDKFLKDTGRGDADAVLSQLKSVFNMAHSQGVKEKDGVLEFLYNMIDAKPEDVQQSVVDLGASKDTNPFYPLTLREVEGIIEAFCDMLWMGFKLSDVATRNMAVLEQDKPSEPTIIIFDR